MAGPALLRAAMPVRTKMPVPMMTPTPKTVRSQAESDLRSACSGSSVSRMDCSTVLVRNGLFGSVLTDAPPKKYANGPGGPPFKGDLPARDVQPRDPAWCG